MRHRKAGVKLGRTSSHRNAMFRNMVTSLLKHERIKTTDTKAKELRRWADHVITLAKRGDLHARRQALSIVMDKTTVHKLFEQAQELFGDRAGGYTRLTKIGRRPGDAAPMTMVELIVPDKGEKKKKKKDKTAKKQAPAATAATPEEVATPAEPPAEPTAAPEAAVEEPVAAASAESESSAEETAEAPEADAEDTAEEEVPTPEDQEGDDEKQE